MSVHVCAPQPDDGRTMMETIAHGHGKFEGYATITTAELRDQGGTVHRFAFEGLSIPAADPLESRP